MVVRSKEPGYPDTPEGPRALLDCATGRGEALALLKFCLEKGVPYTQPESSGRQQQPKPLAGLLAG